MRFITSFCSARRSVFTVLFFVFLLPYISLAFPLIPSLELTPGHLCEVEDSDFKEYRYQEQIPYCKRSVSSSRKHHIYDQYGIPKHCRHRYTIDHLIPLALGGSNANENLWPEHVLVKDTRSGLEIRLYWALRKGQITQQEAVHTVITEKYSVLQVLQAFDFKSGCDIPTSP